ncbi:hypothetical protein GCM10008023_06700 [Sphingomonas glacialis]|uniref:DUF5681 domain-containing protein n=1 Tax=Sphingomonas glacialis TaxID=658225 RepID=A0ABQ3LDN2_9SPHN|nr:DUF5681 domain-containing protein [Sphingomonas glacialis]GHH09696.1 hypothetical protein GCM10008023_06700 [Sphingomonas glacialis]
MESPKAPGFVNPPPRKRPQPPVVAPPVTPPADTDHEARLAKEAATAINLAATSSVPKRAHSYRQTPRAKKEERILGDYPVGYCRAPEAHQFQIGNKGGPGRPRGSKSQNSLLRAELDRKHTTREGGKVKKTPARDLISRLIVTGPISSRNYKDLARLNALARDLYPDPVSETGIAEAYDPAKDEAVLRSFLTSLQLGEASATGLNPLADRATGRPDPGQSAGDDAWNEGDWDGNPGEASDEDH